jgi:lipoate synthase
MQESGARVTKSSIMLGCGETREEVVATLQVSRSSQQVHSSGTPTDQDSCRHRRIKLATCVFSVQQFCQARARNRQRSGRCALYCGPCIVNLTALETRSFGRGGQQGANSRLVN